MATKTTTKTAAKPAAKAAAKPAAKAAAKPAAKAAAKPAAKAAAKPAAKPAASSTELSVTGNKKILTLAKEFSKKFPYLYLGIYYSYCRQQVAKGESISRIDGSKTLASVRRADSGGDITITGNKKVKSLEKEFDTVFGLYAQVCYRKTEGGGGYYTGGSDDEMTLSALNEKKMKEGAQKVTDAYLLSSYSTGK